MIRSNPHTHTTFCDGKNTVEEMVEAAIEKGFVSLGFSGHSRHSRDLSFCLRDPDAYRKSVRAAQKQYADRIRIWLGIEWDGLARVERSEFDYALAATHRLVVDENDISVDGDREKLDADFETLFHKDGLALAKLYYQYVREAAEKVDGEIFAHFDLVRKYNDGNRYFDTANPLYRRAALDALETVRLTGYILEVNTGGMARGATQTPYPDPFLLEAWHEMGGEVIVSSDCHETRFLDYAFDECVALLRRIGFESVVQLGREDTLFEYLPLDEL